MLTADLIRPRIRARDGRVWTVPLAEDDPQALQLADDVLGLFAAFVGRTRGELDEALSDYEGDSLEYPVIRGLAKTLSDQCDWGADLPANDFDPAALRRTLFDLAVQRGPVTEQPDLLHRAHRATLLAEVAETYAITPGQAERVLYADLAEAHLLQSLGGAWRPADLLARYNLELARGLLYWASELRIVATGRYKDLFKYIKLFKLLNTIRRRAEGGYHITLDGPASPFIRSSTRYGFQFARFLPALLLCDDWAMEADIHLPRGAIARAGGDPDTSLRYTLSPRSGLKSHYRPGPEFDSRLEADFAAEFEEKYGSAARRSWAPAREDELIQVGDTVMIPDFSLTHRKDGRRALIELAGFWHPEYIKRKVRKLREARRADVLIVAYEWGNVTDALWDEVPNEVIKFTRKPVLKEVLAAVERVAVVPPGRE
ncbi:MAG: DUF790 family protein [Ardenticatenaceae bacterium]|nr:DUF790 family protein [Ardenticatenaceae bacterium]